jgi:hypothetical protein
MPISIHTVVAMMIALTHTAGIVVRLAVQVQPQNFHRVICGHPKRETGGIFRDFVRTSHSSQRQRGCKARLEPSECESTGYDTSDRFLILMWRNRTANETLIQIGKEIPRQGELS